MTPDQLEAAAARREAEAKRDFARGMAEANALRVAARQIRGIAAEENSDSTLPAEYETIESMLASEIDSGPKRRTGPRLKSKGPIAKVARLLGISLREVSKRIGAKYPSVKTWDSRGPVPEDISRKLLKLVADSKTAEKPAR